MRTIDYQGLIAINEFNSYLAEVGRKRSISELRENLLWITKHNNPIEDELKKSIDIINNNNTFLSAISNDNITYLQELYEKDYHLGAYKDTSLRLAVKWGSIECLFYLYTKQCYNINTCGLNGLMRIVAELGSPTLFDKIIERYYNLIINYKKEQSQFYKKEDNKEYTIADFYNDQNYIDFTDVLLWSLKYGNMFLTLHLLDTEQYQKYINYDELKQNTEKTFYPFDFKFYKCSDDSHKYSINILLERLSSK